jgi:phenylpropionate dioxygenase-like ring-hydroxylating dioxygenase large terminal subunit
VTTVRDALRADPANGVVGREIYLDPEILELEKEHIFRKTWHYACTIHDLKKPGDFYTVSVADEPVMVVRGADDKIRAFYNACTHRAAILTGDRCGNYGQVLKCMYHAWAFNLKGDLVGVPYEEDYPKDFKKDDYGLIPVHVDTFEDLVFVALEPTIPSLADFLGEMVDHLRPYVQGIEPIGRNSWVYEGNWKLWHENFRDNYHPEFTHRSIHDMTPHYADRGGNWGVAPGHSVLQWVSEQPNMRNYARSMQRHSGVPFDVAEDRADRALRESPGESPQEVLAVFPNFDIQPGLKFRARDVKSGYIQTVTPVGVDRAKVEITVYSDVNDDPERRQAALENLADSQCSWGKVSCDDTEAALRCQIGLRAKGTAFNIFTRGEEPGSGGQDVSARAEYSQREFYRTYEEYMAAGRE